MNRLPVFQRHHAKRAPSQFGHDSPVTNPAIRLGFTPQRIRHDPFALRVLDVRPLAQDLLFEIARGFHGGSDYRLKKA